MPYTRGLLREAMRLYPVAPFLTRLIPNSALQVQHANNVNFHIFCFSLDHTRWLLAPSSWCPLTQWPGTRIFSTNQILSSQVPTVFIYVDNNWRMCCNCSERWERGLDSKSRAKQAFATLPFGHGPRGCIGESG